VPQNQEECRSSTRKDLSLEVACLCNLALANIKLERFGEVEEACCRALYLSPSCSKARFRRGQARLASGKLVDAAADFQEAAKLEPGNTEICRMLLLCKERKGLQKDKYGEDTHFSGSEKGGFVGVVGKEDRDNESTCSVECNDGHNNDAAGCTEDDGPRDIAACDKVRLADEKTSESSSQSRCENIDRFGANSDESNDAKPDACSTRNNSVIGACERHREARTTDRVEQDESFTSSTRTSGFLVSGWLSSEARAEAEMLLKKQESGPVSFCKDERLKPGNITHGYEKSVVTDGGSSGVSDGSTSVSYLVSGLRTSEIKSRAERSKTRTQSDWSSLDDEENHNLKELRQRLGQSSVALHAELELGTPHRKPTGAEKKKKSSSKCLSQGQGASKLEGPDKRRVQESEWASLVAEEKQVREAFRCKLAGFGHKEKGKKRTTKK
ncbi:unnamed protein product, partial [Sphacelaria rigidula]